MRITLSILALTFLALTGHSARQFTSASSMYLNSANFTGATDYPMTLAAWGYFDTTNAAQALVSVSSGGTDRVIIGIGNDGRAVCTSVAALALGGSTVPSTWHHIAGTFASSSSRVVWLDGTPRNTNTTAVTLSGIDRVTIGSRVSASVMGNFMNGRIAEAAVWNVVLTADELASLAAGFKPSRIRPQNLVFYAPLYGVDSPEQNWIGTSCTLTNAPTAASHTRVY